MFIEDVISRSASLPALRLDYLKSGDQFIVAVGDGQTRQSIEARYLGRGLIPFEYLGKTISDGINVEVGAGVALCDKFDDQFESSDRMPGPILDLKLHRT